jgi:hypothetical protein
VQWFIHLKLGVSISAIDTTYYTNNLSYFSREKVGKNKAKQMTELGTFNHRENYGSCVLATNSLLSLVMQDVYTPTMQQYLSLALQLAFCIMPLNKRHILQEPLFPYMR